MKAKLGDIVKIKTGKLDANCASKDGIYPFFTCSRDTLKIDSYSYDCECVLVAGNGDLNVKYYKGKFDAYQRTYIIENVDNDILYMQFLYCFMESYVKTLREKSIGGVIKYIKLENLTDARIDLPSVEEQKQMVSVLSKVRTIVDKRKKELKLLEDLVNARFVEMFGEYPSNDKKWETCTVGNVVSEVRYGSSRPAVEDGRYPYLRMNNITYSGYLDLNDVKRIDIPDNEVEKCSLRRGDVLFNRTNSKELVGKTCVYNRDEMMILAGFVIRIRMGDRMLPEFLSQFLNTDFSKRMLLNMCRAAIGQANINAQELKNIGIYLPPIDRQKEFVVFREKIDKSKLAVQKSLEEAQLLFDSLMQEYFG